MTRARDNLLRQQRKDGGWAQLPTLDSDAHATGQLEWQPHGCDRAAELEVPLERIVNTWAVDDLLAWAPAPGPRYNPQ